MTYISFRTGPADQNLSTLYPLPVPSVLYRWEGNGVESMGPESSLLIAMREELDRINAENLPLGHSVYLLTVDIKRVAANIIAGGFDA